jgi:hypothetical protein
VHAARRDYVDPELGLDAVADDEDQHRDYNRDPYDDEQVTHDRDGLEIAVMGAALPRTVFADQHEDDVGLQERDREAQIGRMRAARTIGEILLDLQKRLVDEALRTRGRHVSEKSSINESSPAGFPRYLWSMPITQ